MFLDEFFFAIWMKVHQTAQTWFARTGKQIIDFFTRNLRGEQNVRGSQVKFDVTTLDCLNLFMS